MSEFSLPDLKAGVPWATTRPATWSGKVAANFAFRSASPNGRSDSWPLMNVTPSTAATGS